MDNHYIGIAGITSRAQIDAALDGYPEDAPPLAIGVLASYKTLILRQPNRYPNRYPKAEDIRGIWSDDPRVRNVLHYSFAEDDMDPSRSANCLVNELDEIRELMWPRDLWLQVNARPMIRPWQAEALARAAVQWTRVIVQVSKAAMDLGFAYLQTVLDQLWLSTEKSAVTLLFDASGGTGVPLDVTRVAPLIRLCRGFGYDCGVAGGLSPDTLLRLRPLFDICPLSVDTETWPRDADDHLDIAKARAFRDAARELYR